MSAIATEELDVTMEEEKDERTAWDGVLAIIGHPTSDRRFLIPDEISHRDLPLPFLVQTQTDDGHHGAEVAGRIEEMTYIPIAKASADLRERFALDDLGENVVIVYAEGTLDGSEHEEDAIRMIENGAGVSIDLPPERVAPFDPETLEELDPKEIEFEDLIFGNLLTGIAGKIAAATIVSIPAFEEASIALRDGHAIVASAYGLHVKRQVLTASAAGLAPLSPPTSWFFEKEPDEPTPLTITDKGKVFGHLALWDQCHVAFASCERPPRSGSGYSFFHVGEIRTKSGQGLSVGRITVGTAGRAKGGHASVILGRQGAMEHYDSTGCVGAFVRASDGKHGIWLSGAVRSDAPAETVRDLRANPPSGDWRNHELVAVLAVPVPGFPIPRAEARLVASAAGEEEVAALIQSAYELDEDGHWSFPCEDPEPMDVPTYRAKMKELSERARAALKEAV